MTRKAQRSDTVHLSLKPRYDIYQGTRDLQYSFVSLSTLSLRIPLRLRVNLSLASAKILRNGRWKLCGSSAYSFTTYNSA